MRRVRVLAAAVGLAVVPMLTGLAVAPAAHAGCPDPDYPCDPPPHQIPPIQKPSNPVWLEWGCGTVTIHVGAKYELGPFEVLPCPGPVIF